jgi:hypothetical protein
MQALSPELYFALTLAAKMAITGIFLVVATVLAERSGPLVGGLVTTLPISAGPTYFFLAFDHSPQFLADGALITLVFNAVNALFALVYAVLAQKRSLAVSIGGALLVWVFSAPVLPYLPWTLTSAILVNVIVILLSLRVTRDLRHTRAPRLSARWYELLIRAIGVALLVGFVVGLSFRIGPAASGMLATFPIVFSSVIVIMHRRAGGPATAAILANALLGMTGFGLACVALHLAAVPLGAPIALALAIAASIGWGLLIYALRRRHIV